MCVFARELARRQAERLPAARAKVSQGGGLPSVGSITCAHASVTMLAEKGVRERVAQKLAGYADARMTREI